LNEPDLGENSHSLAFELLNPADPTIEEHFYVLLNAYWEPLDFDLPELPEGRRWARLVDTGQPAPWDFSEPAELLPNDAPKYSAKSRSAVVLVEQAITQGENEP
jgi:glycogen operon protein